MRESALALCCLVVAACGSMGSTTTPPGDDAPPEDTTRPTVVSVSPADQAVGVESDATIVITFSEPMDLQATQTALQSPELPLSAAVLTWDPDGKVLTITPNQ